MKQLTCEMCGSNNLVKQEGLFVCQDCGTKYSVEEAKKMMVEGTVHVDSAHLNENYYEMAQRAYRSDNNAEAESYCNKILEVDPNNYQALMLKGIAAGWQTTLENNRFAEAVNCFSQAVLNAPEEERDELIDQANDQIQSLGAALVKLQGDRFKRWPDAEEATGLLNVLLEVYKAILLFAKNTGAGVDSDKLIAPVTKGIYDSIVAAWNNKIVPDYKNDCEGHPDDRAWNKLMQQEELCETMLQKIIESSGKNPEFVIVVARQIISINTYMIDTCSWEYRTVKTGEDLWYGTDIYSNKYVVNRTFTAEAKSIRRKKNGIYQNLIAEMEKQVKARKALEELTHSLERKARVNKYWEANPTEKEKLEAEKEELQSQIDSFTSEMNTKVNSLKKDIDTIPGKTEVDNYSKRIADLSVQKNTLGLFKGKEKKALQEQIDQLTSQRNAVKERMAADEKAIDAKITVVMTECGNRIKPLQARIGSIISELENPLNGKVADGTVTVPERTTTDFESKDTGNTVVMDNTDNSEC